MAIRSSIKANLYKDSVSLMRISQITVSRSGVQRATLLMGTSGNKEFLAQANLMSPLLNSAKPSDIMIVVEDVAADKLDSAEREIHALIDGVPSERDAAGPVSEAPPRSISAGVSIANDADLALISVPGPYAAAEALKALRQGLNVLLFSDNVPIEQEYALKQIAVKKNLMLMGPDCGTAVINGVPLGFANVVRRGDVGLVGASGTGLQAIMCQIHHLGGGVSHAIGTGSRDVYEQIGAATMLQGLELLADDDNTRIIVIISKPPASNVQKRVLAKAAALKKPVVVCFLGGETVTSSANVYGVATLQETAVKAIALAGGGVVATQDELNVNVLAAATCAKLRPSQQYLRGLYSGGTFCLEAQLIWRKSGIQTHSNVPFRDDCRLKDPRQSSEHTAIDLGSDEFTVGRPHPMIDYGTRIDRLLKEAADPAVACIVLDVVLGYGSHPDPANVLGPAIREAKSSARAKGRELPIVCFVCGTDEDPQQFESQKTALSKEGAILAVSSTAAAELAAAIAMQIASNGNGSGCRVRESGDRR